MGLNNLQVNHLIGSGEQSGATLDAPEQVNAMMSRLLSMQFIKYEKLLHA